MSDAKPIRIFSDAALIKMQHTRDVLSTKFNPYFSKLKVKYSKDSSAAKEIDATLALIGYCINFTSTALGPSSKFIKDDHISLFYQRLDELEAQTDYWLQQSKKDAELSSKMGNIEVELGISIDELENMASYVLSSKEQLTQKGKAPTLISGLAKDPRVGGQVSSMAGDLANQILGPFAGIAGFGKDIFSSLRRQMIGRQQQGWMKGLYGGSTIPGSMKEDIFSSRQSGASVEGNILNASMENFFDRKAYSSKWTKEVLESLKKLTGETKNDNKANLGDMLLKNLMTATLIVSAGTVFIGASRFISSSVDAYVEKTAGSDAKRKWTQASNKNLRDLGLASAMSTMGIGGSISGELSQGAMGYGMEFGRALTKGIGPFVESLKQAGSDLLKITQISKSGGRDNVIVYGEKDPIIDRKNRTDD